MNGFELTVPRLYMYACGGGVYVYDHYNGDNCALAVNQSVDCRATTLFTIGLNSAKV